VVRRLPAAALGLLQVTGVLGDAVSLGDVAAVAGRPPGEVAGQLAAAFDARRLDQAGGRVVFRRQLVPDAIYRHLPAPARRLLRREAAVALTAAGAGRLEVAGHLLLGAERGGEPAVAWLREAARQAQARAPLVAVELIGRAEALLPGGHRDADLVSAEVVQALLRAGTVAGAPARAGAVLARPRRRGGHPVARGAGRRAGAAEPRRRAHRGGAGQPGRPGPAWALRSGADAGQRSWALTYTGDPRAGESAARRAPGIAGQAGDAAMTVRAPTALLVAAGRQGRYGEALAGARRAAALAAGSPDARSLPLQPKLFLGLALDDEFGSGFWLSETPTNDARAAFAPGGGRTPFPALVAGGQAARDKGHQILVAQPLAYRAIIATATGDHRAAGELAAGIAGSPGGGQLSYHAGILACAVAGVKAAGAALAPQVPTPRALALRCQGRAGGQAGPALEAVALARRAPLLAEHAGACEDAAALLARAGRPDQAAGLLAEALDRYQRAGSGPGCGPWAPAPPRAGPA
jgi:hypothetical protein